MSDVVLFQELTAANGKIIAMATLNTARSLNALSGEMIDVLYPKLLQWRQNDDVAVVFLQGSGDKAFCAGGDIVDMYNAMKDSLNPTGENDYSIDLEKYFTKEYQLDYLIHTFDKPFVVWGNGIVMGGGLGMMVGASHRVVTETSRIAMPEISIGLYPDVGGTRFLNNMPESCGLFLGLTGASINAADAKYSRLADYFILSDKKACFIDQLTKINWGNTVVLNHEKLTNMMLNEELNSNNHLPISQLKTQKALIAQVMDHDNIIDIVNAIVTVEVEDKWFNRAQQSLKHGSAISQNIVYQQLQQGKNLSLADCFRLELNLSVKAGKYGEFVEGVRALLIDKDNQPKWKFTRVEKVDPTVIEWFFKPKWSNQTHPLASLGQ